MRRHGDDNRVIVSYLVMVGVLLALFVTGNVAWQHWYCGTPLTECRMFAGCPCEPIDKLLAEKAEFERLAVEHPYHYVGTKTSH